MRSSRKLTLFITKNYFPHQQVGSGVSENVVIELSPSDLNACVGKIQLLIQKQIGWKVPSLVKYKTTAIVDYLIKEIPQR